MNDPKIIKEDPGVRTISEKDRFVIVVEYKNEEPRVIDSAPLKYYAAHALAEKYKRDSDVVRFVVCRLLFEEGNRKVLE